MLEEDDTAIKYCSIIIDTYPSHGQAFYLRADGGWWFFIHIMTCYTWQHITVGYTDIRASGDE